jgi:antitoxin PrlF
MVKTMHKSKVTAKGQTTLPRDVRSALGLEAGDTVRYIVEHGRVEMLKARHVSELAGMLHRPGRKPVSLDEMNEAIALGAVESGS